jgi:hypothetical protein
MKLDINSIITFLGYALPFIIGLLMKSPLWKSVPQSVATVLAQLDATTIAALYAKVRDKRARSETAMEVIQTEVKQYLGIELDNATAKQVVYWLQKLYGKVVK